jgi:Phage integrase family
MWGVTSRPGSEGCVHFRPSTTPCFGACAPSRSPPPEPASPAGLHTLRHSAASVMLTQGVPLKVVSEILGHSSIAITGDVYGHVAPDVSRGVMDILGAAFGDRWWSKWWSNAPRQQSGRPGSLRNRP